jgi:hypothetical protein
LNIWQTWLLLFKLEWALAVTARSLRNQSRTKKVEKAYCAEMQVPLLIAAWRLMLLMFTSIVALSKLDACIYTMLKGQDIGYTTFLAMAVMLHSLQV